MSQPRTPTTSNEGATLGRGGRPRLPEAVAVGFGALFAAALFLGLFDHGLPPKPTRAAAATAAAMPSAPGLCFHGPGGELVDFAPAGQRCA
jgi:hypothetical protein